MKETDVTDLEAVLERLRAQASVEDIRVTQHAQQEMVEEDIALNDVFEAIARGQILEDYPEHRRGDLVVCSTVLRRMVVLCTSYAQRRDQCLSLSRSMNPNHQGG